MGKFDNILILSDFDGTYNGKSEDKNVEAIEYLKENGGHFAFSTGRFPSVMKTVYPRFREIANAPLVMANGAIIHDPETDRTLETVYFDGEVGRAVANDFITRFPGTGFMVYPESAEPVRGVSPDEVKSEKWIKMNFFFKDADGAIEGRKYARETYGDRLNAFRSFSDMVEFVSKDAAKGRGIDYLRKYFASLGLCDLTVCCIGDSENDRNMLECADVAFCPSNALEEIKNISHHVVCHHNEGAVANMIEIIEEKYIR